jgi:hypothetical protein
VRLTRSALNARNTSTIIDIITQHRTSTLCVCVCDA